MEPWFDWALNEECVKYEECDGYTSFTDHDKAVFHVEYADDWASGWDDAEAVAASVCDVGPNLDTLVKLLDLGAERLSCDESG